GRLKIGKFAATGVRAHPNQKWSTAKTAGKTAFPGVFACGAMPRRQKPTQRVGSAIHGPGTGAIRRVAQLAATFGRSKRNIPQPAGSANFLFQSAVQGFVQGFTDGTHTR